MRVSSSDLDPSRKSSCPSVLFSSVFEASPRWWPPWTLCLGLSSSQHNLIHSRLAELRVGAPIGPVQAGESGRQVSTRPPVFHFVFSPRPRLIGLRSLHVCGFFPLSQSHNGQMNRGINEARLDSRWTNVHCGNLFAAASFGRICLEQMLQVLSLFALLMWWTEREANSKQINWLIPWENKFYYSV